MAKRGNAAPAAAARQSPGSGYAERHEFTAAEVYTQLCAEAGVRDAFSPVLDMLRALHRRLVREEARRDTVPSDVGTFGCKRKLAAAGFSRKGPQ